MKTKRSAWLILRVRPASKALFADGARRDGKSLSAWIRGLCFRRLAELEDRRHKEDK